MIGIELSDGVVLLKTLDQDMLDAACRVYNSSGMQYATGISGIMPHVQLSEQLQLINASDNEFIAGIFFIDPSRRLTLIGLISGVLSERVIWIKLLAVLPPYRRQGIGTRAAELILRYGKVRHDAAEAFLSIVNINTEGIRFWTRQGFAETESIYKHLFSQERSYKVIVMNKKL